MLQLLTTTGCRNEAFQLCQRWMKNQSYSGDVHWIIVDDGETPQTITFERPNWKLTVLRPEPFWQEGDNTQKRNLIVGLAEANRNDPLIIIEDDDYYHQHWLATVNKFMQKFDLLGEKNAHYYNIFKRVERKLQNTRHSSLCSTAVKGEAFDMLVKSVETNEKFIDMWLWKKFRGAKRLLDTNYVIGIKGMPGRENIGIGKTFAGNDDTNHETLRRLIGEDAKYYEQF